jgi:hypothetical protein
MHLSVFSKLYFNRTLFFFLSFIITYVLNSKGFFDCAHNRIEFAANAALWHDNLIIQIRFNLKRQTCFVYRKAFQPFTLSMPLNIFEICPTFCSSLQFSTRTEEEKQNQNYMYVLLPTKISLRILNTSEVEGFRH